MRRRAAALTAVLVLGASAAAAFAAAPGELDATFAGDGTFTEPIGGGARPGGRYDAIAVQPDGRIVAAGASSSDVNLVVRINPDGTLDPAFDGDGKLLHPFGTGANEGMNIRAVAIAPDGKIVIAGYVQNYTTQAARATVVRLTPQGTLDTGFDGDGFVVEQLGESATPFSTISAAQVLADGRILLAGTARDSTGRPAVLLARRKSDGTPDPTFGSAGKRITQFGTGTNRNSGATAMEVRPDGRIVIAGTATDTDNVQPDAALLARFDADGQALDGSFGAAGRYVGRLGTPGHQVRVNAMALQPDGRPVVVGNSYDTSVSNPSSEALVARLEADGAQVDAGFGTNGSFHRTFEGPAGDAGFSDVVLQPDGKIVAAGNGEDKGFTILLARLTAGGALDPSFSADGRDLTQLGGASSALTSVALVPGGRLVAAGNVLNNVNGNLDSHPLMARYIADLPPSASFTASPDPATTAQDIAFDGGASQDPEGAIAAHQWDFGDGAGATGPAASHRYAAAGSYAVRLTVRDAYGLTSTAVRTITVTPAAAGAGGAPVITALRITPASFAAARRGASVARDTGARVTYTTSRAATTRFTVARRLPGRRVGRRCGAPTRRTRRAPRCTRLVRVPGGFTRSDTAGRNALRFTGRIGGRALAPGRYRLSATPSAGGISGRAVSAAFRIVR